jgi:hypothetical protein
MAISHLVSADFGESEFTKVTGAAPAQRTQVN